MTPVTSKERREQRCDRVDQEQVEVGMKPVRLAGNPFGRGLEEAHEVKQVEQAVYLYPLQQSLVVLATEWTHVSISMRSLGKGKAKYIQWNL